MNKKIIFKFILIYVLIAVLGFVLISTIGSRMVETQLIKINSRGLYNEASLIASDNSILSSPVEDSARQESTALSLQALASYHNSEIWLLSSDGTIYFNTADSSAYNHRVKLEGFDPVALGNTYYSVGTFFDHFDSERISVLTPIASNLKLLGYVAVHMPMTEIISQREEILFVVYILALILFLIFLSVFLLLYLSVLRPLKKITIGTQHYANGDLEYNIPVESEDEMGQLASSLNYMSDEMNKTGEYERNFIANVSHDFRSPLTSIKGYVEAMLDGTIPKEMQDKYLRIVLAETERLTKLTNGILTLNNMDRKRSLLMISDFDINAVIRDTAAAFEGICTPRQISIRLYLTEEKLFVSADLGKIQQVLYNLIDNAIKFSKDNSSIEIESDIRHEKVYISVRDHGVGIPRESLNKIWERFYKTDASRGRERKGNGLGLSIVKEIITQHEQNITAISTEGVGTEFVFSLEPAAPA